MNKSHKHIIRWIAAAALLCCTAAGCADKAAEDAHNGSLRIVSLSPSITRQIADLGAEQMLVGVTSYHPPLKHKADIIGTLISPNFEKVLSLKPDIVLFSKEDSATQSVDSLKRLNIRYREFPSNTDFKSICRNYAALGKIISREKEAQKKIELYTRSLSEIRTINSAGPSVLFLVSVKPLITVSGKSFIGHIISDAGGKNIFADASRPYPLIAEEAVIDRKPEVIFVMVKGGVSDVLRMFAKFHVPAARDNRVFLIRPDHVAYYNPADYVEAVRGMKDALFPSERKVQ